MGTRSILGYVKSNGKVHCQYLQYDGYPTVRGAEFFEFVRETMSHCPTCFLQREGDEVVKPPAPNELFFSMVRDHINERQWLTHHSINNHWTCVPSKFTQQDAWQEWQYLFERNGDFKVFLPKNDKAVFKIPFKVLLALTDREFKEWECREEPPHWRPLWDALENFKPCELRLSTKEVLAFPDQRDDGWRSAAKLQITGWDSQADSKVVREKYSLFGGRPGDVRNEKLFCLRPSYPKQ